MAGHSARVGTLAWKRHLLSSGSRDSSILQHDVRVQNHTVAKLVGHNQEVSGGEERTTSMLFLSCTS